MRTDETSAESPKWETIEELFTVLEGPLLGYALRYTGDRGLAEDVVQDAFMKLHAQFDSVDKPRPWLYRTVHNLALNQRRAANKTTSLDQPAASSFESADPAPLAETRDPGLPPDEQIIRLEGIGLVRISLAALDERSRELVRLKFTPNRNYNPPSRVEEVLSGMDGYLLIDLRAKRLAKIDGTLYRDINFGWGLVGRLDKGGHFVVQQADLGDGSWDITDMHLDIKGKILLVKSISMVSDETFSDFRRMPDNLPFAKGVEMLKAEIHHDHITEAVKTPHP